MLYSAFTYYTGFKVNSGNTKSWVWLHMANPNTLVRFTIIFIELGDDGALLVESGVL